MRFRQIVAAGLVAGSLLLAPAAFSAASGNGMRSFRPLAEKPEGMRKSPKEVLDDAKALLARAKKKAAKGGLDEKTRGEMRKKVIEAANAASRCSDPEVKSALTGISIELNENVFELVAP